MPRYKARVPEFLAVQFTGSNIKEVLDELGGKFGTSFPLDAKDYPSFVVYVVRERYREDLQVSKGDWIVHDPEVGTVKVLKDTEFKAQFEAVKQVGRPKGKKSEG